MTDQHLELGEHQQVWENEMSWDTHDEDDEDDPTSVDYKRNVVMKAGKYTDEELRLLRLDL